MYHAETGELPAAFADGSRNGGERHGASALRVVEKVPGQQVEIQARHIGTTMVVRQVGRYLTFAVRMPQEVVTAVEEGDSQDSLYLCLHGCPLNQRIDFQAFRARAVAESYAPGRGRQHGFTYQTAVAKCRERLSVEDLYFHSCVFDLLTSGDTNFTLAAYYAFEDAKMLHSNKDKHHIFDRAIGGGAPGVGLCSASLPMWLHLPAMLLWFQCCSVLL